MILTIWRLAARRYVSRVSQQLTNDPIGRAVLESLAWLLLCLDEADDDEVDPDAAVRWTENVIQPLWRLPATQRQELAAACRAFAEETGDPGVRMALLRLVTSADLDRDQGA
jgi:hypothetical protein